jgi:hypothetical protein
VVSFGGKGEGGLAVVRSGVEVGAVGKKQLDDFEMAVGGSSEERGVSGPIAIIGVQPTIQEPLDDFCMPSGDGGSESVVAGAIGGSGVDVRAFFGEIAGSIEMTEETCESENGEAVGRTRIGERGIFLDEMLDTIEIAGSRCVVEFK